MWEPAGREDPVAGDETSGEFREPSHGEFLAHVRLQLGRKARRHKAPDYQPLAETLADQERKVAAIRERLAASRGELAARLAAMASTMGWQSLLLRSPSDVYGYVAELVEAHDATSLVRSDHPVMGRLDLDGVLGAEGIAVTPLVGGGEGMRYAAAMAAVGISGVEYAVAETGSCVLVAGPGVSRTVHTLPPVYVAVVDAEQIVETLDDALALLRLEFLRHAKRPPPYFVFVSGPSRTGDIEQTIVIGAHGPREAHMLIINGAR